jgi:predicted acyltransferase
MSDTRLVSLDVLRGFDMFWILGADAVVYALGKMQGPPRLHAPVQFLADEMEHVDWTGLHFYDLIFPLFIFIVGVSLVFSLSKLIERQGRLVVVKRILIRAGLLILLGIFYNGGLGPSWPNVRLSGVLQRIGISYAVAALLFCYLRTRMLVVVFLAILIGYWALLTFMPIRDFKLDRKSIEEPLIAAYRETGDINRALTPEDKEQARQKIVEGYYATQTRRIGGYEAGLNLPNHFDFEYLPGRLHFDYYDAEGLLSMLPAIATCLLGVFAGLWLRHPQLNERQRAAGLYIGGFIALALGYLWSLQFPIIKLLWTSSYVLVTGGWSLLLLAAFYYIIDVRGWRSWAEPFVWIGMNAITLYLLVNIVSFRGVSQRLVGGSVSSFFDKTVTAGFADVVTMTVRLVLVILVARFLYQRKIFLKV